MNLRNFSALLLILASLTCLYPGLTMKMMTVSVNIDLPIVGNITIYEATQSIIETIKQLFSLNNDLVAWLILLFSVFVPVLKSLLLLLVLLFSRFKYRANVLEFVSVIGKWSMADVFVVGVFMAFLATQSNSQVSAVLHHGFYYFTGYCLLSILGTQLIQLAGSSSPALSKPA